MVGAGGGGGASFGVVAPSMADVDGFLLDDNDDDGTADAGSPTDQLVQIRLASGQVVELTIETLLQMQAQHLDSDSDGDDGSNGSGGHNGGGDDHDEEDDVEDEEEPHVTSE